jgi:arginine repressor
MKDILLSLLRQILTAAGAAFAAKGYLDAVQLEAIIGGLVAVASVIWAVVTKKNDVLVKKELEVQVIASGQTPVTDKK